MVFHLGWPAGAPSGAAHEIDRSLLCGGAAHLSRTPAIAGNQKTWTWSCWVKCSALGAYQTVFGQGTGTAANGYMFCRFDNTDKITVSASPDGGTASLVWTSDAVFRDPSAHLHLLVTLDTTEATATNRLVVAVNGDTLTGTHSTSPALNADMEFNRAAAHQIGAGNAASLGFYFSGYLSDICFIDGQALTPDTFGEINAETGQWVPKAYIGSYGTNGFHLPLDNDATTTTLGEDASGNGNNWTLTGFTTADSVKDTPTDNFCTLNPLALGTDATLSDGNLDIVYGAAPLRHCTTSTIGMSSGKWYFEAQNASGSFVVGISNTEDPNQLLNYTGFNANGWGLDMSSGVPYNDQVPIPSYSTPFTVSDVLGVAFDADLGSLTFYKNGVSQGVAYSGLSTLDAYYVCVGDGSATAPNGGSFNFGQKPFAHTPPAGFLALSTKNLPEPLIANPKLHFDTLLYTGTGAAQSITGLEFSPDLLWTKSRSDAFWHALLDSVRGAGAFLYPNETTAEGTWPNDHASFDSNGFSFGSDGGSTVNNSGSTYAAWCWKEGVTPGLDIVSYTGNGAFRAISHDLGDVPAVMLVKARTGSVSGWPVDHVDLRPLNLAYLNSDAAQSSSSNVFGSHTASQIALGSDATVNANAVDYIAYLFAEVPGFSKIGSYTGNGSADGPYIDCGFRPALVMVKRTDVAADWIIHDAVRNPTNPTTGFLYPNLSNAEGSAAAFDFVSTGFKLRSDPANRNASGGTYIFCAFAEAPFKYANAR